MRGARIAETFPLRHLVESAAGLGVYSPGSFLDREISRPIVRAGEKLESKAYRCRFLFRPRQSSRR